MKKKLWTAVGALALIGAATTGVILTSYTEVTGAVVTRGDLVIEERVSAQLVESNESELTADRGGVVESVNIAAGDELTAGDSVFTLSDESIKADIAAVSARLSALGDAESDGGSAVPVSGAAPVSEPVSEYEDELALAVSAAEQVTELALGVGVEYVQLNDAVERVLAAQASAVFLPDDGSAESVSAPAETGSDNAEEREKLEKWIDELEAELTGLTQIADVSGSVSEVLIEQGDTVAEGDVIAVFRNPEAGMVTAMTSAGKIGDSVRLTTGERTYTGKIVSAIVKNGERTLLIQPQQGFAVNGGITATVTAESALDVCLVPVECIAEDEEGEYAMVLDGGRLAKRRVTTALDDGVTVAVTSGLGVGERAIAFPERYEDGERAKLAEE